MGEACTPLFIVDSIHHVSSFPAGLHSPQAPVHFSHSIFTTGSYSSPSPLPNFTKTGPIHHTHHPLLHHRPFLPPLQIGLFNYRTPCTVGFHLPQAPIYHSPLFSLTWTPIYRRPSCHRPPQTTSPCSSQSSAHHRLPLALSPTPSG